MTNQAKNLKLSKICILAITFFLAMCIQKQETKNLKVFNYDFYWKDEPNKAERYSLQYDGLDTYSLIIYKLDDEKSSSLAGTKEKIINLNKEDWNDFLEILNGQPHDFWDEQVVSDRFEGLSNIKVVLMGKEPHREKKITYLGYYSELTGELIDYCRKKVSVR